MHNSNNSLVNNNKIMQHQHFYVEACKNKNNKKSSLANPILYVIVVAINHSHQLFA